MVKVKRIYEPLEEGDGFRVLVDRIWPRGVSKGSASIQLWLKDIAPSTELRKWFGHDPTRWESFRKKYIAELRDKTELVDQLKQLEKEHRVITLLYSAKDERFNQAVVLHGFLKGGAAH